MGDRCKSLFNLIKKILQVMEPNNYNHTFF